MKMDDFDFVETIILDLKVRHAARQILEVGKGVNRTELKKAYRRASLRYHSTTIREIRMQTKNSYSLNVRTNCWQKVSPALRCLKRLTIGQVFRMMIITGSIINGDISFGGAINSLVQRKGKV